MFILNRLHLDYVIFCSFYANKEHILLHCYIKLDNWVKSCYGINNSIGKIIRIDEIIISLFYKSFHNDGFACPNTLLPKNCS